MWKMWIDRLECMRIGWTFLHAKKNTINTYRARFVDCIYLSESGHILSPFFFVAARFSIRIRIELSSVVRIKVEITSSPAIRCHNLRSLCSYALQIRKFLVSHTHMHTYAHIHMNKLNRKSKSGSKSKTSSFEPSRKFSQHKFNWQFRKWFPNQSVERNTPWHI